MQFKTGITRRAHWQPLEETFIVITMKADRTHAIDCGGWTAEGKKVWLQLDRDDLDKIAEKIAALPKSKIHQPYPTAKGTKS